MGTRPKHYVIDRAHSLALSIELIIWILFPSDAPRPRAAGGLRRGLEAKKVIGTRVAKPTETIGGPRRHTIILTGSNRPDVFSASEQRFLNRMFGLREPFTKIDPFADQTC